MVEIKKKRLLLQENIKQRFGYIIIPGGAKIPILSLSMPSGRELKQYSPLKVAGELIKSINIWLCK
jgi:hypothetical protein